MKTFSNATAPAMYTNSFAATLTVAAILGLAAGAKTARAWDQQATAAYASAHQRDAGADGAQRDFQLEGR